MKRLWFSLLWYVMAVIIVDIPPVLVFFLMHRFNLLGSLAPQVISTFLFLALLAGQGYLHLRLLNRLYPHETDRNAWTMLAASVAAFATFWLIIIALIAWATSKTVEF
ncbi:MAG: hypothetical protein ACYDGS_01625 [Thermoleophilia bacterium]